MSGVLFVVCIPREEHEKELIGHRQEIKIQLEKEEAGKSKSETSMEEIMVGLLKSLKIENYSWIPVESEKFVRVIFSVPEGPFCEETLRALTKWGIGIRLKSTLGIIPCTMYFQGNDKEVVDAGGGDDDEDEDANSKGKDKSAWNEFVLSVVRSRLVVAQVVESVKGSAKLTFDFLCLVILAATISAVGLVENSTVSIVASMLISPLMGPILAGTFGTVIHDRKLQLMGVRNELFGLSITILVGYIVGLIIGSVDDYYGTDQWPTQEMMSRGWLRSLWVGALIALPSGAGVALGLLGDNSGSLIGVAISASLLPPAVNAGLFWALATLEATFDRQRDESKGLFAAKIYSHHLPSEYALLGCVSLSLTLVNIVCIFIAAIIVLKVKEVAPRALKDEVQQFWQHDIRVARDYNRTVNRGDASNLDRRLAEEIAAAYSENERNGNGARSPNKEDYFSFRRRLGSLYHFSPDTLRRMSSGPERLGQATWSPSPSSEAFEPHSRFSVKDLDKLYASEHRRLKIGSHGLKPVRGNGGADDVPGLTPIIEKADRDAKKINPFLPHRRNFKSHRFTVIPIDNS